MKYSVVKEQREILSRLVSNNNNNKHLGRSCVTESLCWRFLVGDFTKHGVSAYVLLFSTFLFYLIHCIHSHSYLWCLSRNAGGG